MEGGLLCQTYRARLTFSHCQQKHTFLPTCGRKRGYQPLPVLPQAPPLHHCTLAASLRLGLAVTYFGHQVTSKYQKRLAASVLRTPVKW
jgi:hypothetical protein